MRLWFYPGLVLLSALSTLLSAEPQSTGAGDVLYSQLSPEAGQQVWLRKKQVTPAYPFELAQQGVVGCGVFKLSLSESGKLEQLELVSSVPKDIVLKPTAKVIKGWKWVLADGQQAKAEQQLIRLDFCMAPGSAEQVHQLCVQQSQYACEG